MNRARNRILNAVGYLWRHHRMALVALGLVCALAAFFAIRLAVFTLYWADPAHQAPRIEPWMTPGYVARAWDVDVDVIRAALPVTAQASTGGRLTLDEIAATSGVALPAIIAALEAAIRDAQAP